MNMILGFLLGGIISFYSIRKEVRLNRTKKDEYHKKTARLKSLQKEVKNFEKSVTL